MNKKNITQKTASTKTTKAWMLRRSQSLCVGVFLTVLAFTSTTSATPTRYAGATFMGLGVLPGGLAASAPTGISADGSVVVGTSHSNTGREAFRWTADGGMVGLGELPGPEFQTMATGVSADGSVIVGERITAWSGGGKAFRWTQGNGMVGLGDLPEGVHNSKAYGVSADGSVIVGNSFVGPNSYMGSMEAFRWSSDGGLVGLGDLPGGDLHSSVGDVSADGSVVVGKSLSASGMEAFRWTSDGGMVGLGDLPGGSFLSRATGVSADGSVVVGNGRNVLGYEAFRWTLGGGMVGLGDLPGGAFSSVATGVSADGSVVVGSSGGAAFIWDEINGMQSLEDLLMDLGADLTGWDEISVSGISADGRVIMGVGSHVGTYHEAWRATLQPVPEPATVLLIGSGLIGLLGVARRKLV